MPRFEPYTAKGITRVPCARCGAPGHASWNVCADRIGRRTQYRALCVKCDVDLNTMVMRWMFGESREAEIERYACAVLKEPRMENPMTANADPNAGSCLGAPLPVEEIAQRLFALLDDCDTADDIAKGDDALFRLLVRAAHQKRFRYATTDGYTVTLNTQLEE